MTEQLEQTQTIVVGGVDAHTNTHHVVAVDLNGRRLGSRQFPATGKGYRLALDWLAGFGVIEKIGVGSTGSYAAGLARVLLEQGVEVVEVNQPHAHLRARRGKDDAIDAEAAALKVLSGQASASPKKTTGAVESIRIIRLARDSAVRSRTRALLQLRDVLITAPTELREQITERTTGALVRRCSGLPRPGALVRALPRGQARTASPGPAHRSVRRGDRRRRPRARPARHRGRADADLEARNRSRSRRTAAHHRRGEHR